MKNLTFLAAAVLAAAVSSQSTSTFTSPRGLDTTEGSSNHGYILGSENKLRWQQLDPTSTGNPAANIRSIAWRRDFTQATNAAFGARTFMGMSVIMAHTTAADVSQNYSGNYKGQPTVVFTPKTVNGPDWSTKPTGSPAAFNFKVIFDTPWTYNGTDDMLWEVQVDQVTPFPTVFTNYPFDFNSGGASSSVRRVYQYATTGSSHTRSGINYGTGCTAGGQTSAFLLTTSMVNNTAGNLTLRHGASRAPANAAVITLLGTQQVDLPLMGLCSNLLTIPLATVPMGTASSTGSVSTQSIQFADNPAWHDAVLYAQAFAADASQSGIPAVVSQGEVQIVPDNVAKTNSGPWTGGIVAQFEY